MQARLEGHSWLIVHSGLHSMYGFPWRPGRQVQAAALFLSEHTAFVPQGVGLHGSIMSGFDVVAKIRQDCFSLFKSLLIKKCF